VKQGIKEWLHASLLHGSVVNASMELFTTDDENSSMDIDVQVGSYRIRLEIPQDDYNTDKKTLFATFLWNGAVALSEELLERRRYIEGKRVLELGAAAGLPSIVVGKMEPRLLCASDYPSPTVLATLQKNLVNNQVTGHVVGHVWGTDVSPLLRAINGERYDVIVASECIWRHECHDDLLTTITGCVGDGGVVIMTYSHHIPGLEEEDDRFLQKALASGLTVEEQKTIEIKSQWDPDKTKLLYFVMLRYAAVVKAIERERTSSEM
jgi:nicotinamide N-methyltransferase